MGTGAGGARGEEVGAWEGVSGLDTAPGPFLGLVGLSLNRARLCGQALSRGFWAYGEFRIRSGYLFEERRTDRVAYRTARTSGPQVSSPLSTGRERCETASGCGHVSSRFTRGGGVGLTCKAIQSSWKHLSVLCGSKFKAIQILDFSSGAKENCLKIGQISSATQWCSGVPES